MIGRPAVNLLDAVGKQVMTLDSNQSIRHPCRERQVKLIQDRC